MPYVLFTLLALAAQDPAPEPAVAAEAPAAEPLGGVAVVVNLPQQDAALREVATGALDAARQRWGLLRPPLKAEAIEVCQADNLCLINLANKRGASHLFVVGVAPLGEGEVAVSLLLFETKNGIELMSYTDILVPHGDRRAFGRRLTLEQTEGLTGIPGPDEVVDRYPPPPPPEVETYSGLGVLSIVGWSFVGGAALVATSGLGFGVLQTFGNAGFLSPTGRDVTVVVTGASTLVLLGIGLGLVSADLFLQQ